MKTEKDKNIPYKVYLSEDELPKNWYNVRADMKQKPAPLLNPDTDPRCRPWRRRWGATCAGF